MQKDDEVRFRHMLDAPSYGKSNFLSFRLRC